MRWGISHRRMWGLSHRRRHDGKRQWFLVDICDAHSNKVVSLLALANFVNAVNDPSF
jgi:hypothetical protein